eukprot:6197147-Pleurochrysis_carterae.AAC.1
METSLRRGYVADTRNGTCFDAELLEKGTAWYYGYNVNDPYLQLGCRVAGRQQFVPMHWCVSSTSKPIPPYVRTEWLLGFNEPNNKHNCNLSPLQTAKAWKAVMDHNPTARLVSPSTSGDGIGWFRDFFGNCTAMYGEGGCRITHMAVHSYICDSVKMHGYLESLHHEFRLPIWLTEFACGDKAAREPLEKQMRFMKEMVPILDRSSFIFRYAWMSARQDADDHRGLLLPGKAQLSELGRLYTTL